MEEQAPAPAPAPDAAPGIGPDAAPADRLEALQRSAEYQRGDPDVVAEVQRGYEELTPGGDDGAGWPTLGDAELADATLADAVEGHFDPDLRDRLDPDVSLPVFSTLAKWAKANGVAPKAAADLASQVLEYFDGAELEAVRNEEIANRATFEAVSGGPRQARERLGQLVRFSESAWIGGQNKGLRAAFARMATDHHAVAVLEQLISGDAQRRANAFRVEKFGVPGEKAWEQKGGGKAFSAGDEAEILALQRSSKYRNGDPATVAKVTAYYQSRYGK
jgi:hypothetical protein